MVFGWFGCCLVELFGLLSFVCGLVDVATRRFSLFCWLVYFVVSL